MLGPVPQLVQRIGPRSGHDAVDERRATIERRLGQLQAEQALDEPARRTGLDTSATESLGRTCVLGDQAGADRVENPVHVSLDRRDDGLDLRHELALVVRLHRTEQHVRIAGESLQCLQLGFGSAESVVHAEIAHAPFDLLGILAEGADVFLEQCVELGTHVSDAQNLLVRDVRQADPQADSVTRQAPRVREIIDIAEHERQRLAVGAGERQLVVAERTCGEVSCGAAGHHAEQHRSHHPHELTDQRLGWHAGHLWQPEVHLVAVLQRVAEL